MALERAPGPEPGDWATNPGSAASEHSWSRTDRGSQGSDSGNDKDAVGSSTKGERSEREVGLQSDLRDMTVRG